ncbi:hypothetical protein AVEN_81150-1 [Araneus ventricosus]|uniref:Uncharacterized protein n=1 Tax=Araneus ventricosus TaxID=182803 RepID=A0A4Y2UP25_ARAVE|nr:hypothetical protein AVEN_81150-1 [Araneus ventricosus]
MFKEEEFPVLTFEKFPCRTQSVERCVELISEAALKVFGETARNGYICAKLQARKELPTLNNKGQYYSNTKYSIRMKYCYKHFKFVDFCSDLYSVCM